MPHVVLLLLVPAEDANLTDIRVQEPADDGIAERPGATRNQQYFVFKHDVFL